FWMLVQLRAMELQDPRVTDATVSRAREQLPGRILSATAGRVAHLLAGGADERARAALAAMARSRFPDKEVHRARCDATERTVARATDLLTELRSATDAAGEALDTVVRSRWTVIQ